MAGVFRFDDLKDDVDMLVRRIISSVVGDSYVHGKVGEWTEKIGNEAVKELQVLSPNFKWVVNTLIMQKVGAGLHLETCCSWDAKVDGSAVIQFSNDALSVVSTVYGIGI